MSVSNNFCLMLVAARSRRHVQVPPENCWMFLERQCVNDAICSSLRVCAENCREGDLLFIYLGGHGSVNDKGECSIISYSVSFSGCNWQNNMKALIH